MITNQDLLYAKVYTFACVWVWVSVFAGICGRWKKAKPFLLY